MGRKNKNKATHQKVEAVTPAIKKAIKEEIHRDLAPEVKEWNFTPGATQNSSNIGTIQTVPLMAQGLTSGTRIGNRINICKITMNIRVDNPVANLDSSSCRILLIRAVKNVGFNTIQLTDMFFSPTAANSPLWIPQNSFKDDYVIMYDHTIQFNKENNYGSVQTVTAGVTTSQLAAQTQILKYKRRFKRLVVQFNNINPLVSNLSVEANAFYLLYINDSVGNANPCICKPNIKFEYTDV